MRDTSSWQLFTTITPRGTPACCVYPSWTERVCGIRVRYIQLATGAIHSGTLENMWRNTCVLYTPDLPTCVQLKPEQHKDSIHV